MIGSMLDAVRAGFLRSRDSAENLMFPIVGAGDSPVRGNVRVADKRVSRSVDFCARMSRERKENNLCLL